MNRSLILLFGMPRSGTTWLGKIFDSHPEVLYRHEPDSWLKLTDLPLYEEAANYGQYRDYLLNYASGLEAINLPQVTTKRPLFPKQYSGPVRSCAYRASVLLTNVVGRVRPSLVLPTLNPVSSSRSNLHIAWKSIESLGRLGVIAKCLPESKSIHIIRHPCGYIASVLKGEQGKQFVSASRSSEDYDLFRMLLATENGGSYGLSLEDLKQMTPEERLAWRWLLVNEKALKELHEADHNLVLRYEDLCENPLQKSQELFRFAGLAWNPQSEGFVASSVHNTKDGYYSVFKNPQEAANKWRNYLSVEQQALIRGVVDRSEPLAALYADLF
ncbi:MAG: sulfotransferase [Pseudomonadales bacterium]|jgi:hypothetical protein